jgi:hypothetical protein
MLIVMPIEWDSPGKMTIPAGVVMMFFMRIEWRLNGD